MKVDKAKWPNVGEFFRHDTNEIVFMRIKDQRGRRALYKLLCSDDECFYSVVVRCSDKTLIGDISYTLGIHPFVLLEPNTENGEIQFRIKTSISDQINQKEDEK